VSTSDSKGGEKKKKERKISTHPDGPELQYSLSKLVYFYFYLKNKK